MSHSFKQISPTDHFGWHAAYLPVYERLFAPSKNTVNGVLEIGTDGGGGMLMYADYFRAAMVSGMDVSPTPECLKDNLRLNHIQRDAYTLEAVEMLTLYEPFAVIIDDGPHTIGSQEFFVANYPRLLTNDGLGIVEDIQDPADIAKLARCVPDGFASMAIDLRHVNGRYDDLLFVIWRA